MKLPLLSLTLLGLVACEAGTTTPLAARPLTHSEVSTITARARAELAPAITDAMSGVLESQFFRDADFDATRLPSGAEVADEARPVLDAIFAESSIEARSSVEITYLVPAAQVCDSDADCVRALTTHPVRVIATSNTVDHVHLAIDVGARRVRLLELDLERDRVVAEVDLAQLRALLVELAPELELEVSRLPASAGGRVRVDFTERAAIVSTIGAAHIQGTLDGAAYRFSLGTSSARLDVDPATGIAVGALRLGAVSAELPFAWLASTTECTPDGVCDDRDAQGQLLFALAAVDTNIHFDNRTDTLILDDFGLGGAPATISLDGAQQVRFDMNAAQGRTVDLSIRYLRQELEFAVSPSLEAVLDLTMEAVAAQVEVAAWAVRDSVRLRFDGASSPTLRVGLDGQPGRVVSGSLTLVSNTNTLTAMADQCIDEREDVPEGAGLIEALISYPCE